MEAFLYCIADFAKNTLLASFFIVSLLYYISGHPRGATVMRSLVIAIIIIRAISNELYNAIVGMVNHMKNDYCQSITYDIPRVPKVQPTEQPTAQPTATQQATKMINSNPAEGIVVAAGTCSKSSFRVNDKEDRRMPVIVTSSECVKVKKTNSVDDYSSMLQSNINRRKVKFNVIDAPAKGIQMKIIWIINTLNERNLQTKCNEMKKILNEECFPWVSNYFVMELICNKPHLHILYLKFLDRLSIKSLNLLIKAETVTNINALLKRDKTKVNASFEKILNNLGHWFGMITIAKNKPIAPLISDLDTLIVDAYKKGGDELLFTIEFVIKVLESSANSKDFHAKSPWTNFVLNSLAELHQKPDLRLVLKLKIESLCKMLNVELKDLKPGSRLAIRE